MDGFADLGVRRVHESALRSIARVVEETTPPTPDAYEKTVELFQEGPALVLTGAGVSTDSGIPDYRSETGRLKKSRPMTYQEFAHSPQAAHRYWARAFIGWKTMKQAHPNPTHYALAELDQAGFISGLITQNVDELHNQAGSKNVLDLHGNMSAVVCLDCQRTEDRRDLDQRLEQANPGYRESVDLDETMVNPDGDVELSAATIARFRQPGCVYCGSWKLKPTVVYFGEAVPRERRQAAREWLADAHSLVVVGSSLAVMSGYSLVIDAQRAGKKVAIINGGPGRADARADILWRTRVQTATGLLLDGLGL